MKRQLQYDELLTPGEVARIFRVRPRRLAQWASAGRFPEGSVVRTVGGHRRYKAAVIRQLLEGDQR